MIFLFSYLFQSIRPLRICVNLQDPLLVIGRGKVEASHYIVNWRSGTLIASRNEYKLRSLWAITYSRSTKNSNWIILFQFCYYPGMLSEVSIALEDIPFVIPLLHWPSVRLSKITCRFTRICSTLLEMSWLEVSVVQSELKKSQ